MPDCSKPKGIGRWQGAIAAALFLAAVSPALAQAPSKIRVAGPASVLYLPFYIAIEQGYFAQRGIEAELINTTNAIPALISGEVDFVLGGGDNFVGPAAHGRPTPVVVAMNGRNSLSIVASPTVPLPDFDKSWQRRLADLKGRTIALPNRGTGAESLVHQAFNDIGFQEGRDYTIVVVGSGANILSALKAHSVDGALLWSPFSEQSWADKIAVPVLREAIGDGPEARRVASLAIAIGGNASFIASHRELTKKFVAAVVEATAFNRDFSVNKERLIDIATKYTGQTDRNVLALAIESESRIAYPGVNCQMWDTIAKAMVNGKVIPIPSCKEGVALDIVPQGPLVPE